MSLRPATATLNLLAEVLEAPQFTVPLTLALEYAEAHRAQLEHTYDSEGLARRWIETLVSPSGAA